MDSIGIPVCEGYGESRLCLFAGITYIHSKSNHQRCTTYAHIICIHHTHTHTPSGLTETSPVIALNVLSQRKAGSVGQVIPGVHVWIVDSEGNALGPDQEGEICCSGPNVMRGYHNNPEATDEVISLAPDGKSRMFHTGDLGKLGSDGFLSVTGRLKEQYKLENGKYVCPTPIEEAIGMSRFISQVVVTGANRPYNVALVVPDWVSIRSELGLSDEDVSEEELVNDDRVKGLISAEIKLNCYDIKKFEIPVAFLFVSPFTAENNMVTPKVSITYLVLLFRLSSSCLFMSISFETDVYPSSCSDQYI